MPLTIREVGIVPSVHRFVSTDRLLRHIAILGLLVAFTIATSIIIYFLAIHYGHPTQFPSSNPHVGFQGDSGGRDTMDIVVSCATTLITCIYTSVHFDVPRSYAHRLASWPKKLRSHDFWLELWTKVSFWMLGVFSPEMLVLHAFYEYKIARRDVVWMHEHGYTDWSLTLSFAADMGALVVQLPGRDAHPVRSGFALHHLLLWHRDPSTLDCKALEYELADRTKADVLVKVITTLQIVRFFLGVIARAVNRLPVAPVETVICAYVGCTLVYYTLWLYKPYNVNERIVVRLSPMLSRARPISEPAPSVDGDAAQPPPGKWTRPLRALWAKASSLFCEPHMSDHDRLHGSVRMHQLSPYVTEGSLLGAVASLVVGLAHMACWNVEFPNSNGQPLWRYCSLAVVVLPIVTAAIILGAAKIQRTWVTEVMNMCALSMIVVYCIARLVLLILLGHSFQSLPARVYDTQGVSWLSLIPFIH
ncbi:hypothetical protein BD413DRAFT_636018 [Trametes elegans]|nr:hypothetical protein BD413DRAFT_636018 [Trametes elegans]